MTDRAGEIIPGEGVTVPPSIALLLPRITERKYQHCLRRELKVLEVVFIIPSLNHGVILGLLCLQKY